MGCDLSPVPHVSPGGQWASGSPIDEMSGKRDLLASPNLPLRDSDSTNSVGPRNKSLGGRKLETREEELIGVDTICGRAEMRLCSRKQVMQQEATQ